MFAGIWPILLGPDEREVGSGPPVGLRPILSRLRPLKRPPDLSLPRPISRLLTPSGISKSDGVLLLFRHSIPSHRSPVNYERHRASTALDSSRDPSTKRWQLQDLRLPPPHPSSPSLRHLPAPPVSIVPEDCRRIHATRFSGREEAGQEGDGQECHRDNGEGDGIVGTGLEQ